MPDNIGSMFYYGERPWHGKGTKLTQAATADEALREGNLDWEVGLVPIETAENPPSPITRRKAVVRKDLQPGDPSRVVGVVHPGFHPLQNREGVKIFDALVGQGKRVYHTGGYLGKGEVIWLLARLPAEIRIKDDDVVEPYILFTNSHDGSVAVDFRLTTVRVVCQNTLSLALHSRKQTQVFKHAHQGSYKTLQVEAEEFFKFSMEAATKLGEEFQALSRIPLSVDSFNGFVEKLLPVPRPPARIEEVPALRRQYETRTQNIIQTRASVVEVFTSGIEHDLSFSVPPSEETVWGALNAVTAFVDHQQVIKGDRYAHILFGSGADLKQSAYNLALQYLSDASKASLN
jgi:phage/plasmid-like protein (TIGR03299 family)